MRKSKITGKFPIFKNQPLFIRCKCEKGMIYGPWWECYTMSLACIDCKPQNFTWDWCSMCGVMIRCPKCGNNSCNAGYGEINGKHCNTCPDAYEYERTHKPPFLLNLRDEVRIRIEILVLRYYIRTARIVDRYPKLEWIRFDFLKKIRI